MTVDTSSYMKTNKAGAIEPADPYSLLLLNSKVTLLVTPIGKRQIPGRE